MAGMTQELSGTDAQGEIGKAKNAAKTSVTTANKKVNLGNYNETATKATK